MEIFNKFNIFLLQLLLYYIQFQNTFLVKYTYPVVSFRGSQYLYNTYTKYSVTNISKSSVTIWRSYMVAIHSRCVKGIGMAWWMDGRHGYLTKGTNVFTSYTLMIPLLDLFMVYIVYLYYVKGWFRSIIHRFNSDIWIMNRYI